MTVEELYAEIKADIESLLLEIRAKLADGLDWREAWTLLQSFIQTITVIVERINADGTKKKELVLYCVDRLYVEVIEPYDLPVVADWLERRFVDPMIRKLLQEVAGNLVEVLVGYYNKLGWPSEPPGLPYRVEKSPR